MRAHSLHLPAIRTLLPILLTFTLAALSLAAVVVVLMFVHRVEPEFAQPRVLEDIDSGALSGDQIPPLRPGLEAHGAPRLVPADASMTRDRGVGALRVRVVSDEPRLPTALHVVIFDGTSGVRLATRTIDAGTAMPVDLTFERIRLGRQRVRLGSSIDSANILYLAQGEIEVRGDAPATVELNAASGNLRVTLQPTGASGPVPADLPVWIRRTGEPKWRYGQPATGKSAGSSAGSIVKTDAQGTVEFLALGTGTYTLEIGGFVPEPEQRERLVFVMAGADVSRSIRGRVR